MAVTATISLSNSTVQINQLTEATLTVSNSGGSAVNIIDITPTCKLTGNTQPQDKTPFAAGKVPLSAGFPVTVPASGSLAVKFDLAVFEPSLVTYGGAATTYDVGAIILTSGNVYTQPTAATLTVNQLNFMDAT